MQWTALPTHGTRLRWVDVAPGVKVYQPLHIRGVLPAEGIEVLVEVVPRAGRLVAASVTVTQTGDGEPVTNELLRRIPIAGAVQQAAADGLILTATASDTPDLSGERIAHARDEGPTEANLRAVAQLYRTAIAMGHPPAQIVRNTLELTPATAGRWIAKARQRGYLNPTDR